MSNAVLLLFTLFTIQNVILTLTVRKGAYGILENRKISPDERLI